MSFGVQGVLAKYAYEGGADVPSALALRFGVAALALWTLVFATPRARRVPLRLPARTVLGFGLLGALFVTNSLPYFVALQTLPVGTTVVLVFVFPALVALWQALVFGERLSRPKLAALALALAGCVLAVDPSAALAVGAGFSWIGVLWALGSALSNSCYVVLAGFIGRDAPRMTAALYSLPVTAACFGGYLVLQGGFAPGMTGGGWASCFAIGALTAFSVYAYLVGVSRIGASLAAVAATTELATSVLLGALLLSEPLPLVKLLGGGCIVGAVALLSRPDTQARG